MRADTPRARAASANRAKIIRAAKIMFLERGYEGVTMREIATAVGMSTGALFSQFEGKAELFEAVTGFDVPNVHGFLRELSCRSPAGNVGDVAATARTLLQNLIGLSGVRRFEDDDELEGE